MPQLQPEPEKHEPRPRTVTRPSPSAEWLEWPPQSTERLEWPPPDPDEPDEPNEHEVEGDPDAVEEDRRRRRTAAFAGCLHGGGASLLSQLLAGGGGDELLIQGAGTWIARDHPDDPVPGLRTKPLVYCHPSLVDAPEGMLVLASRHPQLVRYLGFVTGGEEPPAELVAIGTEAAIEDWTPGSTVHGAQPGTLGAPCTFNGAPAILTAGHVTDGQATVTFGASTANVKVEHHAGTNPTPLAVGPDFAVIELPVPQGGPALTPRTTRVGPSEPLTMHGGTRSGNVLALATFLRVQKRSGCWGDVYQLDTSIGGSGDSGSAVVDSAGLLAGHYLGRLNQAAIVQDVTYQLAELKGHQTSIP